MDHQSMMEGLPPAVSLKVLELVMGHHQQLTQPSLDASQAAATGLSWVLGGGDPKAPRAGRRGVRLWPPPPRTAPSEAEPEEDATRLFLDEADLRRLDAEVGPGYVVKDGFMGGGGEAVAALRDEVELIRASGQLKPAGMVAHDRQRWAESSARGDVHMWLDLAGMMTTTKQDRGSGGNDGWWAERPHLQAACMRLRQVQQELCRVWGFGEGRLQAQLACYPGGGSRYLRHLDAKPEEGQRRLTLLYYINPGWTAADGGCLRLYPHTQNNDNDNRDVDVDDHREKFVDVEPVEDRLLIFQSRTIEHEVLASHAVRFSLTMWLY